MPHPAIHYLLIRFKSIFLLRAVTENRHAEIRAAGGLLPRAPGGVSAGSAAAGAPLPHRPTQEAADEVKIALAPGRQADVLVATAAVVSECLPSP